LSSPFPCHLANGCIHIHGHALCTGVTCQYDNSAQCNMLKFLLMCQYISIVPPLFLPALTTSLLAHMLTSHHMPFTLSFSIIQALPPQPQHHSSPHHLTPLDPPILTRSLCSKPALGASQPTARHTSAEAGADLKRQVCSGSEGADLKGRVFRGRSARAGLKGQV
jgi:hypothetical protein